MLLDGSALEVFTSSGECLTTRVYRGHPPGCACSLCSCTSGTAHTEQRAGGGAGSQPAGEALLTIAEGVHAQQGKAGVQDEASVQGKAGVQDEADITLFATGAPVLVTTVEAWEMGSCFVG
jgi:hypothetical protein